MQDRVRDGVATAVQADPVVVMSEIRSEPDMWACAHLSSIITAAFSQIALTLLLFHALLERNALTTFPELSENSASIKAAVASAWPSRSSTLRMALDTFLKVFISDNEYDLHTSRVGQDMISRRDN